MKKFCILLVGIFCLCMAEAQTVLVTDFTNMNGLPDVTIKSNLKGSKTRITDQKGEADIADLRGSDSIAFEHKSYLSKVYSFKQLETMSFKVSMTDKIYSLNELVISASRFEEKLRDVAQPVQILKAKELAFMNQSTSADVLQNTGNVMVQKSQQGGGSPIIRGFETNKVLIVVDGVRMNNAIYRGGHLQNVISIDNTMLDRVEVVFGPGSVVYGSDALGGVMHFYSKNPSLSVDDKPLVKAGAFVRYASANNENSGHVDFNIGGKKFGSITSYTFSEFDDLRQGANRNPFYGNWGKRFFSSERYNGKDTMLWNSNANIQKSSGYAQYDILQKFLFKQNLNVSHILNFQYSNSSNIPRYDRLTLMQGNTPRFGDWYYGPQQRFMASYKLQFKSDAGFYDNGQVILAYQKIEESRHDRRFKSDLINRRTERLDVMSLNIDFAKKIGRQEIRYGMDAWYNDVNSSAYRENINSGERFALDTRYPDGGSTMQSVAAYVTHSWEISDQLILNDGVRVNNVQLNAKFDDQTFFPFPFNSVKQNNTAVNGNVGLVYMPGGDWRFTMIASSGFRAPNVDDLSKVFESVPGSVVVPNPNLKPEYTYNGDIGFSKTFKERINVGGTAFYTIYKNALTTRSARFNGQDSIFFESQLSRVTSTTNAAEAYIYGGNVYLNADINNYFSISSSLNYTHGRIVTDTVDYPLDHIPPVFGRTSFNLKLKKFRGEFYLMYHAAKKSEDYNLVGEDNQAYSADPVKGYMPSWTTLNLRTSYQVNKYLQLQLAIENILDKHYQIFASNIAASGRNLIVTLRGNF
jgi:hemoglobin/transferrin/lactoferrin receptor protein